MSLHRTGIPPPVPESHVIAAELLEGLELLRAELGSVAEELIALLRRAGIRPPGEPGGAMPLLH